MYSVEGLKEKFLSFLPSEQQWKFTYRNKQPIILNTFSLQEFKYYFLSPTNRNINIIFQNRQKYALPNTPKIIALPNKKKNVYNQPSHLVLGQKAPYSFERLLKYHTQEKSILKFCQKLFDAAEMLVKKFGYFDITEKMITATKGPSLILWINQNIFQNKRQHPLINVQGPLCEDIMIRRILRKISAKVDHPFFKQTLSSKNYVSFQKIKSLLKQQQKSSNQKQSKYEHASLGNSSGKKNKIPNFLNTFKLKVKKREKGQFSNLTVYDNNQRKYDSLNTNRKQSLNTLNFSLKNYSNNSQFQDTVESIRHNFFNRISSPKAQSTPNGMLGQKKLSNDDHPVQVRDSGKTLSTASQWYSMNASGRKKMMEINNSFDVQKRRLLSTFGSSHKDISLPQKEYKDSRKFNIKESKIIQENLEETYIQSPLMKSPRCISINTRQSIVSPGEQLEKQFSHLFKSGTNERQSIEVESEIENELNRLLFD